MERSSAHRPSTDRGDLARPPVQAPDSPLIAALQKTIPEVLGREAQILASPGTYARKHVARIGGLEHTVAYGPGILEPAHQVDEYCDIDALLRSTEVPALSLVELAGSP